MTTILATRDRMISDSKATIHSAGLVYPATKIFRGRGMIVGACGDNGDCTRFIEWAQSGYKGRPEFTFKKDEEEDAIVGLVLKADGIYIFCPSYPVPEKINAEFYAIGSGGDAARTAMILGQEPERAVEIACQVDEQNSGLPLQILKLEEK